MYMKDKYSNLRIIGKSIIKLDFVKTLHIIEKINYHTSKSKTF